MIPKLKDLLNEKTIACGECLSYVYKKAVMAYKSKTLKAVYGTVTEIGGGSKRFPHAWIEDKGRVFDWQTMVHKLYSRGDNIITKNKWDKKGYPIKDFYRLFNVKKPKKYTPQEVADNYRKHKSIMGWDWK